MKIAIFYAIRNIAFVNRYLDEWTVMMLLHNYVINRLDYGHSLYYGLSNYQLESQCYK